VLSTAPITWRSLASIAHAVGYELIGSTRCRCAAETPPLSAVTSHTASNHTVIGIRVLSKIVPAVTDTRLRQPLHRYRPE
jgi:hypothetical protein